MKNRWAATALLALLAPAAGWAGDQAAQVFSAVSPSVYSIIADGNNGGSMLGSGVVVGHGRVVTNFHVINGATRIRVRRGNEEIEAQLESSDKNHDLALLQVPGVGGSPVSFGETSSIRIGQTVYAVGSPRGLELSLSEGLISSLRETPDGNAIQTTAPISPGSSGGGLFDEHGLLLGFTTAQVINGQNLNFAVPVEWLRFVGVTVRSTSIAAAPVSGAIPSPAAALEPAPVTAAPAAALEMQSVAATQRSRNTRQEPLKSPNLYIASAMIALLLIGAKPAVTWLSDYMSSDALPTPRARKVGTPAAYQDRLGPFRALSREEIKSGQRDADTWLLALEQCGGDEHRATVAYIEQRAMILHKAEMDRRWEQAKNSNQHPGNVRQS